MFDFEIIIDTREKKNKHLTDVWDNKIKYEYKKIDYGDYTIKVKDNYLEKDIVIERKNSIDELCLSFAKNRNRFRNEFKRAAAAGNRFIFLLIEDCTIDDIAKHNYRSKMHPNALLGSINSWKEKYNIYVIFVKKENAAMYILNLFNRYYNKYLK